jgi:hypothetical protein
MNLGLIRHWSKTYVTMVTLFSQRNSASYPASPLMAGGNDPCSPLCGGAPERRDALGGGHDTLARAARGRLGRHAPARPPTQAEPPPGVRPKERPER